jgi:hypothetical protein
MFGGRIPPRQPGADCLGGGSRRLSTLLLEIEGAGAPGGVPTLVRLTEPLARFPTTEFLLVFFGSALLRLACFGKIKSPGWSPRLGYRFPCVEVYPLY